MKIETIQLERVEFMPKELEPGILYVAEEFGSAAHLCACGCGCKVRTPLGPTDWSLAEIEGQPTLEPSVGNWQLPCKSHYLIIKGKIVWAAQWSDERIESGRRAEAERAQKYYEEINYGRVSFFHRLWTWILGCFRK